MTTEQPQRSLSHARPDPARTDAPSFAGPVFTAVDLVPSWELSLRARRLSERTITDYVKDTTRFLTWLAAQGMPVDAPAIAREHIEAFIVNELERKNTRTGKPLAPGGSAASAYRRIQQFFKWLEEEGEITSNPMAKMSPPALEDKPVPVLEVFELKAILADCEGPRFIDRRDNAIVRTFVDTGVRVGQLAGMQLDDIAWRTQLIRVYGKGRGGDTPLDVPFGAKTGQALDRYIRARARRPHAGSPWLWIGDRGRSPQRMTESGIAQMLTRRSREAGIDHVNPHRFRHTAAHQWLLNGGQEGDLMELFGWKSRDMLGRYGRSAAQARARKAHREMGLGEDL